MQRDQRGVPARHAYVWHKALTSACRNTLKQRSLRDCQKPGSVGDFFGAWNGVPSGKEGWSWCRRGQTEGVQGSESGTRTCVSEREGDTERERESVCVCVCMCVCVCSAPLYLRYKCKKWDTSECQRHRRQHKADTVKTGYKTSGSELVYPAGV